MYTASIRNSRNNLLTLTGKESQWQIMSIDGLDQPIADIFTQNLVGVDGTSVSSAKLQPRNIVITLRINGDVAANRRTLYSHFLTKESCSFSYSANSLSVYINGTVESVSCPLFTNSEIMQISILCPYPYFTNSSSVSAIIPSVGSATIQNTGDNAIGLNISITAESPFDDIAITMGSQTLTVTSEFVDGQQFTQHDIILISTKPGQKSVQLVRRGNTVSIFSSVGSGSKFFSVPAVSSKAISYTVDGSSENNAKATVTVTYAVEYRGV